MANTNATPSAGTLLLATRVFVGTPTPADLRGTGQTATLAIGAGSVSLTPAGTALTLIGLTGFQRQQNFITTNPGALTVAGQLAAASPSMMPVAGALTLTGLAPLRAPSGILTPGTGALTLTIGTTLTAGAGSLTATGGQPALGRGPIIVPTGALTLTGVTASMGLPIGVLQPRTGQLVFGDRALDTALIPGTGAAFFGISNIAAATGGTLTLTGQAPSLLINVRAFVAPGALTIVSDPSLIQGPQLVPGTGSLAIAGTLANASGSFTPGNATLTLTGQPAVIVGFNQAQPVTCTLALTGAAPAVLATGLVGLIPGTGSLTLAASQPVRVTAALLTPSAGGLIVTGVTAALAGLGLRPNAGTLILASDPPTLFFEARLVPIAGALTFVGARPNVGGYLPAGGRIFRVPKPATRVFAVPELEEVSR